MTDITSALHGQCDFIPWGTPGEPTHEYVKASSLVRLILAGPSVRPRKTKVSVFPISAEAAAITAGRWEYSKAACNNRTYSSPAEFLICEQRNLYCYWSETGAYTGWVVTDNQVTIPRDTRYQTIDYRSFAAQAQAARLSINTFVDPVSEATFKLDHRLLGLIEKLKTGELNQEQVVAKLKLEYADLLPRDIRAYNPRQKFNWLVQQRNSYCEFRETTQLINRQGHILDRPIVFKIADATLPLFSQSPYSGTILEALTVESRDSTSNGLRAFKFLARKSLVEQRAGFDNLVEQYGKPLRALMAGQQSKYLPKQFL